MATTQVTPVRITEHWHRVYNRNTGNCDWEPYYTVHLSDGDSYQTHTVDNKWLHLIECGVDRR